tara:strand:+ start:1026 stop:1439 length:414 start_codon:yes stop_codon:yes gene_type:complete
VFDIFKKKTKEDNIFSTIGSLLIHAAKIDENYTNKEREIIKKTLIDLGSDTENIDKLMNEAENNEKNSNQLIDFTKKIKKLSFEEKKKIVESLWNIIYSDSDIDMYESNLMRRLSGLLYLDHKIVGELKDKIKSRNK